MAFAQEIPTKEYDLNSKHIWTPLGEYKSRIVHKLCPAKNLYVLNQPLR